MVRPQMILTVESQIPGPPGEISLRFLPDLKLSIQLCKGRRQGGTDGAVGLLLKTELEYRGGGLVLYCFPIALGFDDTTLKNHVKVGSRKELR